MKLTKQQLKQIIKEELDEVVNEYDDNSHLPGYGGYNIPDEEEMDQALDVEAPPPAPRNAEEEMSQWFAANPNASARQIREKWNGLTDSYRSGGH